MRLLRSHLSPYRNTLLLIALTISPVAVVAVSIYYFIAFNLREGRLYSDVNLRTAFSMCIDHDATVQAAAAPRVYVANRDGTDARAITKEEKAEFACRSALASLGAMRRAGVKVCFGTDLLGSTYTQQCREFTLRREVFTPLELLRQATSTAAGMMMMEGQIGCVAEGAFADLIVVDGDPLTDIGLVAADGAQLPPNACHLCHGHAAVLGVDPRRERAVRSRGPAIEVAQARAALPSSIKVAAVERPAQMSGLATGEIDEVRLAHRLRDDLLDVGDAQRLGRRIAEQPRRGGRSAAIRADLGSSSTWGKPGNAANPHRLVRRTGETLHGRLPHLRQCDARDSPRIHPPPRAIVGSSAPPCPWPPT